MSHEVPLLLYFFCTSFFLLFSFSFPSFLLLILLSSMTQRSFDDIDADVLAATRNNDAAALLDLATELDALESPNAEALAHRARGWAVLSHDKYHEAIEHLRAALALYDTLGDRTGMAIALDNIGSALHRTGNHAAALDHHSRALAIGEEANDLNSVARTSGNLGNVLLELNDYDAAMTYYRRALDLSVKQGRSISAARITGNMGIVYYNRGDYRTALEYFQRSLDMYGDEGGQGSIARGLANIGNVYAAIGDTAAALEHYHRSMSVHADLNELYDVALVTTNIGVLHFDTGDNPTALEHFERALDIFEEIDNQKGIAYTLLRIGLLHHRTGQGSAAIAQYQRARTMYAQLGERSHLAGALHGLGEVYDQQGNHALAKEHYEQALTEWEELGERYNIARVRCALVGLHLAMGDLDAATETLSVLDTLELDGPPKILLREICRAKVQDRTGNVEQAQATLMHALRIAEEHGLRPSVAAVHQQLRDLAFKRNDLVGYVEHNNAYMRVHEEINGNEAATKLAMQAKQREIDAKDREHQKHLAVLHSTLPKEVADRVARGEVVNDHYDNAAVIFLDIVGFTEISSSMSSHDVIELLDNVFTQCDAICTKHGVTKIKTIGDSYMAVAFDSVVNAALCALEMSRINVSHEMAFRIGLHCGPVTAGVIGKERMQYDVWGDTVNVASRMESSGEAGRVQVTEAFAIELEKNQQSTIKNPILHEVSHNVSHNVSHSVSHEVSSSLVTQLRGSIDIKGKGAMNTYWLEHAS